MRTISSISLLLLLLLNLFGFYVSYVVNRGSIKVEMKNTLALADKNSLEQFDFTSSEYAKLTHPNGDAEELMINGVLYDVKAIEYKHNRVIVFAKRDVSETGLLNKFLSEITSQTSSTPAKNHQFLAKVLQQEFVANATALPVVLTTLVQRIVTETPSLITRSLNLATPPPDFILA